MDINYKTHISKEKTYEKNVDYIKNNVIKGLKIMSHNLVIYENNSSNMLLVIRYSL